MLEEINGDSSSSSNNKETPYDEYYDRNRFNDPSPEYHSNWLSRFSFWWVRPTIFRGNRRQLQLTDIPDLTDDLKVKHVIDLMDDIDFSSRIPLIKHIYKRFTFIHYLGIVAKLLHIVASIITPLLLRSFIEFVNDHSQRPAYIGWLLCFGIFISTCVQSMGLQQSYWYGLKVSLSVRSALSSAIYRKMLRLNNSSRRNFNGKLMNLISVDVGVFGEFFWNSYMDIFLFPIQITLLLLLLTYVIGPSGLVGFVTMGFSVPLSTYLNTRINGFFARAMSFSDERIKLIGEFISGIRFLKLYNWEEFFIQRITTQRDYQMEANKKHLSTFSMDQTLMQVTNGVVLLVTFATYIATGHTLQAKTAFTALTIFFILRNPIQMWPEALQRSLKMKTCGKRIEAFLQTPENTNDDLLENNNSVENSTSEFRIVNGTFTWHDGQFEDEEEDVKDDKEDAKKASAIIDVQLPLDDTSSSTTTMFPLLDNAIEAEKDEPAPVLSNISMVAPKGKLTVIVGKVGEGKTSLVSALIGEIRKTSGTLTAPHYIGFTPQIPWILGGSIRDNILFGKPYIKEMYLNVIEACSLKPDLIGFPLKDLTEIGERGVSLSGGQKQRISLARCLYSNAEAYVMDEPLSAVDAEVGKHLFEHCIRGVMANKTRVLVTHQLQFIPSADHIIVMDGGRIIQGTYDELTTQGIDFESIMKTKQIDMEEQDQPDQASTAAAAELKKSIDAAKHIKIENCIIEDLRALDPMEQLKGKLFTVEERKVGAVGKSTFIPYFKSGGPTILYLMVIASYVVAQMTIQGSDYWLLVWTNATIKPDPGNMFYLRIYTLFIVAFGFFVVLKLRSIIFLTLRAAKKMHERLVNGVFYSPCSFFDSNPSGRILNRFSKDMSDVDLLVVESINDVLTCGTSVIISVLQMIYLTPYIAIPFSLLSVYYFYIQKFYRSTSRDLKRMDAITRSPIYSHLGESFNGMLSIRSFKQQQRFIQAFEQHTDLNQRLFYHNFSVNRWLGMNLEMLTGLMVLCAAVFSMISSNISPSIAGMAVSSAISITGILNWAIRQFTELEVRMTSVERVLEYANNPSEGQRVCEDNRPPDSWPTEGRIEFRNLEVRYRPGLDPSLRDLNCKIESKHKVGLVGRTGAGKSTVGLALFRLVEPSQGTIVIDGVDITKIGLSDLRSRLAVIPQDPFIFSGSVRMNLDPFNKHQDLELWEALEKVNMKQVIKAMPLELETMLDEGGDGFSVGQKQLLCLVRAILSTSPIVLMDEATASLDYHTDALIKTVIANNFANRTVVTIAHRLDTIIDSDRIMVIDKGSLVEYDDPSALIRTNSRFRQLVDAQTTVLRATAART
ncbi:hypothetical protein SAMD00019534_055900 [Acytostelium subglobosum LB1]|uniref:hypothetical protein n=1 Tax=Acytostelium subglobosum LB1 TaxID=1410327 RepID=UPI000644EC79|nr:hypothetical protein SAMD00019534_055900 [Acytostelium subglobosum LB1]GAM22415.1 hypothetical protein SAMD00019534_055900 [Acytostelium subglobosum LB1]|eukprot:XP_012754535.1 hypothetical protein SAMD00019534_055900 [Acytostelium subglobosum LB1]